MANNVAWRCVNAEGDVKYAAREDHRVKLVAKGYTCVLDPDLDFDTVSIYDRYPSVVVGTTLNAATADPGLILSNGNLTASDITGTDDRNVRATTSRSAGMYYFETRLDADVGNGWAEWGVIPEGTVIVYGDYPGVVVGKGFATEIYLVGGAGGPWIVQDGSWTQPGYANPIVGTTFGCAINLTAGKVWFRHNNGTGYMGGGDPATDTLPTFSFTPGSWTPATSVVGVTLTYNFGAAAFAMAPPAGFVSWNSA